MSRKISMRRTLVFAAIAVMALATTAFAIGSVYSVTGHSNNRKAFTQLPTASQALSIIDATPKLIVQFDNDYQFDKGVVVHVEEKDESENVIAKYKALDLLYTNGDADVTLTVEKQKPGRELHPNSTQSIYDGVTLYALDYVQKTVPIDYVKTEQDKLDEAAGRVSFGYMGGDTVETTVIQMLFWDDGEASYSMQSRNNPLPGDELSAMAKQIIDRK